MFVLLVDGQPFGLFASEEHARQQIEDLKLKNAEVKPATFGDEIGKVKLQIHWKLEKFEGDVQSPETLIETIEGED